MVKKDKKWDWTKNDIIEECGRFWNNNIILHVDSM